MRAESEGGGNSAQDLSRATPFKAGSRVALLKRGTGSHRSLWFLEFVPSELPLPVEGDSVAMEGQDDAVCWTLSRQSAV